MESAPRRSAAGRRPRWCRCPSARSPRSVSSSGAGELRGKSTLVHEELMSKAVYTSAILIAASALTLAAAAQQKGRPLALRALTPKIAAAARPLPLNAVRLTGGPLKRAQELDAEYLLKLEPDRMLSFYRTRAGLPKKAEPYGGWDGEGRQLTGHIAGHYLSAVSYMWAATGDPRFKQRADYIVDELKLVQDAHRNGYTGAIMGGEEAFNDVAAGKTATCGVAR